MVEPGRRCLGDRYELFELIAAGGMGQVWRGRDLVFDRPVAVKVLRSEYTGDPTFLARFRAEAQHAAALSHPNIACVFDYGETEAEDGSGETLAYLVMELVEGEPLSSVLRREGSLDTTATLRLLRQAGEALGEAHRVGMVHRDVKPGNLLVRDDGSVKITDFGIAWSAASVPLTRTGQVIGTPQYLSPEQAEGRQATPASDVYALGLVGYECLTGHSAFDGDNAVTIALKQVREQPEPLPAELPPGIRALIDRTLVKDPHGRLPDGAAFVAALDDAAAGRELPAAPATATAAVAAVAAAEAARAGSRDRDRGRTAAAADRRSSDRHPGPGAPVRGAPPRGRYGRRVATVLVPLLALLTGAAIAAVVLNGVLGGERAGGAPAVAADTGGSTYTLVAADYVGRPVDEVAVQLSALGLAVERVQQVTGDVAPGTVVAIDPAGVSLRQGQKVTVSYAVAPPHYGTGSGTGSGTRSDVGRVAVQHPAGSAAATSSAPPPAAAVATPTGSDPTSTTADGSPATSSGSGGSSSSSSSAASSSASSSEAPSSSSSTRSTSPATGSTSASTAASSSSATSTG